MDAHKIEKILKATNQKNRTAEDTITGKATNIGGWHWGYQRNNGGGWEEGS